MSPSPLGRFVSLECPACGRTFELLYNSRSYVVRKQEGKCPDCRTRKITGPKRCMNKYDMDGKPLTFDAPCGRTIVNRGRGRCREYLSCGNYDTCMDYTSKNLWDGWRVVRGTSS